MMLYQRVSLLSPFFLARSRVALNLPLRPASINTAKVYDGFVRGDQKAHPNMSHET